ncbi:FAD/NAD(P)-binding domain-containing protein [Trichodelitschia bisporula]|uniref:FAD/NAD(P)-binding domain-containing protein n=1 Tax=Trichodelitschia bisporula TaxID=703511 RepID=A0A6G1I473_9PEZI|nr:FAD/NAD(P)-binding domain-containing protein [Trichodelitschia bisporula]
MERSSREPLNIVILGASFAGLSAAHGFLRKTIDDLGITRTAPKYRVVLVSPSTYLYWNIGAPRAIVSSTLIPHSTSFIPILDAFRSYPANRFGFIHGSATAVDFSNRNVTVAIESPPTSPTQLNNRWSHATIESGGSNTPTQTIPFHALIVATGTSAESPLLSLHGPHEKTVAALDAFHAGLKEASSVIVAGGGPSGVECAGQLATFLRNRTTDPQSPPPLNIVLVSGNERLLPRLPPAIGAAAEAKLKKLGVHVMHHVRLLSAQELPSGVTRCVFSDDLSITCDLFIAATGVWPNTSFLPPRVLDASGYVQADPEYLRVSGAGDRVYAVGDCAAYSKNTILDVYESIPTLLHNLRNDLWEYELKVQNPYGGAEAKLEALQDVAYSRNEAITQLVPITRFGGVGMLFGIQLPSFLVWLMKGRNYRTNKAVLAVGQGHNPYAADTYVYK